MLQSLVSNGEDSWPQLATSCTTGVFDMSRLFSVRVPPSRVLLIMCRCVVVVAHFLSRRPEIAAHSARPPVPRCAVGCQRLRSGHRCMGRELGDEHGWHVRGTCSSIPRVAAALGSLCRRRRPSPISSLRDRRSLHTAARPSLRCRKPTPSIRTSVPGT
jgi:hypothetical protein